MTETLEYAISKTWYIVLIFVALAIGIAFLSKKKSSKALVALSALCLVFGVGSFAFGGLTVSEAQSKGASSDQLNSMNLIELVQANQAAPAQTTVNDVNELYNKQSDFQTTAHRELRRAFYIFSHFGQSSWKNFPTYNWRYVSYWQKRWR